MEVEPIRTGTTNTESRTTAKRDEATVDEYRLAREEFFARRGARWPGTLYDAFDILAPRSISRLEVDEILEAAANLARVYAQAAKLLHSVPDLVLREMGVPEYLLPGARCAIPGMGDCVIGRLDMAVTEAGYKLLEYNADVPGLLVEAFSINTQVCRDAGADDPNESHELFLARTLGSAVRAGLRHVAKIEGEPGNVVVTSCGKYRRDRAAAKYVCGLLKQFPAQYAPIESLRIDAEGLYDPGGRRIDVLYRVFPLQYIRNELFRRQQRSVHPGMGGLLLQFVEMGRLALINPPFSFLLESKALQVLIWNLFESGQYFDEPERRLIERYMLPTYLDPPSDRKVYVVKPVYGGQGDTVKITASGGGLMHHATCTTHTGQPMVYQKYVELPAEEIMTEYGPRRLHLLTSCFLISGTPAGMCMRAGETITDESAWVLPICIRR